MPNYKLATTGKNRRFTDQGARQIRLSQDATKDLAKQHGVSVTVIQNVRSGATYGRLEDDERHAHDLRTRRENGGFVLADNVLMFGPHYLPELKTLDPVEALDAAHECCHGRLPTDRTDPCGCWPQEVMKDLDQPQPQRSTHVNHEHPARISRLAEQVSRTGSSQGRSAVAGPTVPAGDL